MDVATIAMAHLRDHAPLCECGRRLTIAAHDNGDPVLVCSPCATATPLDGPVLDRLKTDALAHAEQAHALARAARPNLVKPVVHLYRTPRPPHIGRFDTYAYHCRHCGGSWKVYQYRCHTVGCPNDNRDTPKVAPPTEAWRPFTRPYQVRSWQRFLGTQAAS